MKNIPTEDGFYWATSIRRNSSKKRPGYGQCGGVRWIVRVIRYNQDSDMKVQVFGQNTLAELRDYKDWEGPIGNVQNL